jgi:hypothetical protein
MNDDDPKKPRLPRAGWTDDAARQQERERVSKLLDEESTPSTAPADDPEQLEVYGLPPTRSAAAPARPMVRMVYGMPMVEDDEDDKADDDADPVTVYGMPMVSRRDDVEAAPVYGMPSSSEAFEDEPDAVPPPRRSLLVVVAVVGVLLGAAVVAWLVLG